MTPEEKAKQEQERELEQRRDDLTAVMRTANGRRFVWRLMLDANVFGRSMSDTDRSTAWAEGRRDVGIALMTEVQSVVPEAYLRMLSEQLGRIEPVRPADQVHEGRDE